MSLLINSSFRQCTFQPHPVACILNILGLNCIFCSRA